MQFRPLSCSAGGGLWYSILLTNAERTLLPNVTGCYFPPSLAGESKAKECRATSGRLWSGAAHGGIAGEMLCFFQMFLVGITHMTMMCLPVVSEARKRQQSGSHPTARRDHPLQKWLPDWHL